jgi:hypothetical protein
VTASKAGKPVAIPAAGKGDVAGTIFAIRSDLRSMVPAELVLPPPPPPPPPGATGAAAGATPPPPAPPSAEVRFEEGGRYLAFVTVQVGGKPTRVLLAFQVE